MKKGTQLKLSEVGLFWLAPTDEGRRARLGTLRFEYRRKSKIPGCSTVKRLGINYSRYENYHDSLLQLANQV